MRKSTASKIMWIFWRCFFLVFTLFVVISVGAQYLATRRSPAKSEETPAQSQADLNEISVRNALAQPSGDHSAASFEDRGQVQVNNDALPRSEANKLIVELLDKMPTGGEYRASSDSIQKLEDAIKK